MQKVIEVKLKASEAAKIDAAITKCDHALGRLFAKMRKDRAQIEKLKVETREILADLKTLKTA